MLSSHFCSCQYNGEKIWKTYWICIDIELRRCFHLCKYLLRWKTYRWVKSLKKNKVLLHAYWRAQKTYKLHLLIIKYLEENAGKVLLNETTNRLNGRNSTGTNCTVIDSFETIEEIGSISGVRLNYLTTTRSIRL